MKKKMSAAERKAFGEKMKQAREAKKMGLFKKKNVETRTFIDGQIQGAPEEKIQPYLQPQYQQQQAPQPQQAHHPYQPPASQLPPMPAPDPQPVYRVPEFREEPRMQTITPPQPIRKVVEIRQGFFYWLDEAGNICARQME